MVFLYRAFLGNSSSEQEVVPYVPIRFLYAGAVGGERKKRHGFAGAGKGMGSAPCGGRPLSCSTARGLKEWEKKNSREQSEPCLHKAEEEISLDTEGKTN